MRCALVSIPSLMVLIAARRRAGREWGRREWGQSLISD